MNQPNPPAATPDADAAGRRNPPIVPGAVPDERPAVTPVETPKGAPPTGRRAALRDIRRQLNPEETAQTGTVKMLLSDLEECDERCAGLVAFEASFHEADKRAAILEEKLRSDKALDACIGVGYALGGAIVGLTPFFWQKDMYYGIVALAIGVLLVGGALVVRLVKR